MAKLDTDLLNGIGQKLAEKIAHPGLRLLAQTVLVPVGVSMLDKKFNPKQEEAVPETIDIDCEVLEEKTETKKLEPPKKI